MKSFGRFAAILFVAALVFWNQNLPAQNFEEQLQRQDKHFLGGGKMFVWAPEYPRFLHSPGFWDHGCFLDEKVEPLFTITFLDENLKEIPLEFASQTWVPSHLTIEYHGQNDLHFWEEKALLPEDVLVSQFRIANLGDKTRRLHVIVWTSQNIQTNTNVDFPEESKNANYIRQIFPARGRISWERVYRDSKARLNKKIGFSLGAKDFANSTTINVSSRTWIFPHWRLTPFFEKMTDTGLPNENNYDPRIHKTHFNGLLYAALSYDLIILPNSTGSFEAFCAVGPSEQAAIDGFDTVRNIENPIQASIDNWQEFFESVPKFTCSDPYFQKYYYYRWYGLRLNMVDTEGEFNLPYPCVFEGINAGWFRHQISYSAQAHILDLRWMHDPIAAMGSFLNFVKNQNPDGSFPGIIRTGLQEENGAFYHANWGRAIRELHRVSPNQNLLFQAYQALSRYAEYFQQQRDKENMHLYDILNQWETGQEFMNRYLFADPKADEGKSFQLKGVDASVYIYELQKNLAWMADKLHEKDQAEYWRNQARATGNAIKKFMWNDSLKFFVDFNPKTAKKSSAMAATGFYPFFTDLISPKHLAALNDHLFNPNEFWTEFPVPSSSLTDPMSNIYGEWKGKRLVCPWNGRSWLMSTSHVCEALGHTAQTTSPKLKKEAVDLIRRFVRMLFLDGDINRPSSYEYYNPINGKAPFFRGTDDYMHSSVIDLIIKYVVGLQPQDGNKIILDPLPFDLDEYTLDNVHVKGRLLKIMWRKYESPVSDKGLYLFVDQKLIHHWEKLGKYEIELK